MSHRVQGRRPLGSRSVVVRTVRGSNPQRADRGPRFWPAEHIHASVDARLQHRSREYWRYVFGSSGSRERMRRFLTNLRTQNAGSTSGASLRMLFWLSGGRSYADDDRAELSSVSGYWRRRNTS
jgi:hypothetical protein